MGNLFKKQVPLNHYLLSENNELLEVLGFTLKDSKKLLYHFCLIDADQSGEISLNELMVCLDLTDTPFNRRVFAIFDEDNSGEIDFCEFVTSVWNYW